MGGRRVRADLGRPAAGHRRAGGRHRPPAHLRGRPGVVCPVVAGLRSGAERGRIDRRQGSPGHRRCRYVRHHFRPAQFVVPAQGARSCLRRLGCGQRRLRRDRTDPGRRAHRGAFLDLDLLRQPPGQHRRDRHEPARTAGRRTAGRSTGRLRRHCCVHSCCGGPDFRPDQGRRGRLGFVDQLGSDGARSFRADRVRRDREQQ